LASGELLAVGSISNATDKWIAIKSQFGDLEIGRNGNTNTYIYSSAGGTFTFSHGAIAYMQVNNAVDRINIPLTTASTLSTTGALTVAGGVGIGGNLNVGGNLTFSNTASGGSLLVGTGSIADLRTPGYLSNVIFGVQSASSGILANVKSTGGRSGVQISSAKTSSSDDAYLYLDGFAGSLSIRAGHNSTSLEADYGPFYIRGGQYDVFGNNAAQNIIISTNFDTDRVQIAGSNGAVSILSNVTSTNTTSGSLIVAGGVGIGGNLHVGGNISVNNSQAVNGPAFSAYPDSGVTQSITSGTQQKVLFQLEDFDTDGNFASSRFTPTVAGYYQLNASVRIAGPMGTGETMLVIWKNGAEWKRGWNASGTEVGNSFFGMGVSTIAYANGTGDYFEVYIQQSSGSSKDITVAGGNITWFNGCMMRGA